MAIKNVGCSTVFVLYPKCVAKKHYTKSRLKIATTYLVNDDDFLMTFCSNFSDFIKEKLNRVKTSMLLTFGDSVEQPLMCEARKWQYYDLGLLYM